MPAHLLTQKRDKSQLPLEVGGEGWVCYNHPLYGLYYYNEFTNQSTYERPEEFERNTHAFAQKRTAEEAEEVESDDDAAESKLGGPAFSGLFAKTDAGGGSNEARGGVEEEEVKGKGEWEVEEKDERKGEGGGGVAMERGRGKSSLLQAEAGPAAHNEHEDKPDVDILSSLRSEHQPEERIAGGWIKYFDPESGYPYYFNEASNESTYDRPEGLETSNNPFATVRQDGGVKMIPANILSDKRDKSQLPAERIEGGWVKYIDPESGFPYYFHELSSKSTYDRPEGLETSNNPFATVRQDGGVKMVPANVLSDKRDKSQLPVEKIQGGWEKFVDPESGYPYYYNAATEESTYDRPEGFETSEDPFEGERSTSRPDVEILSSRRSLIEEPVELLNGGWEKFRDEESGYDYYYHEGSGVSQYERPSGFSTLNNPFSSARGALQEEEKEDADILSSRREADAVVEEFLNGGWVKYRDEATGYEYYWNESEQISTYDRPDGFTTHQDAFSSVR